MQNIVSEINMGIVFDTQPCAKERGEMELTGRIWDEFVLFLARRILF